MAATELSKRVATGVIGVALIVGLLGFGGWFGTFVLAAVISLGMIFEFSKITFSLPDSVEKTYVLLIMSWLIHLLNLILAVGEFELLIFSLLTLFTYFLFTARRYEGVDFTQHFKELMSSLFGLSYLTFLMLYLPRLHSSPHGTQWTFLFLFIVWSVDTGAYFAGKKYGKRKLYPQVSPKKTVEGLFGGLALALVVTAAFRILVFPGLSWGAVVILPIVIGAISQVGDLCESFLKRAFDKKDSGSILPGHGGFLDRFDGVVFSLPVMYAFTRMFS